jgi:hypothetical protein
VIEKEKVGLGDEVFVVGLFHKHMGKKRNIPVVRFGSICAMPEEPVYSERLDRDIQAYLIESRSIGGLSGAPVFVNLGLMRHLEGQIKYANKEYGIFYLLGLMHGHYETKVPDMDEYEFDKVNMGIAAVIPADKILEVMKQPYFEELRKITEQTVRLGLL